MNCTNSGRSLTLSILLKHKVFKCLHRNQHSLKNQLLQRDCGVKEEKQIRDLHSMKPPSKLQLPPTVPKRGSITLSVSNYWDLIPTTYAIHLGSVSSRGDPVARLTCTGWDTVARKQRRLGPRCSWANSSSSNISPLFHPVTPGKYPVDPKKKAQKTGLVP